MGKLRRRIQRPQIFEAKGIYRNLAEFDNSTGPKKDHDGNVQEPGQVGVHRRIESKGDDRARGVSGLHGTDTKSGNAQPPTQPGKG